MRIVVIKKIFMTFFFKLLRLLPPNHPPRKKNDTVTLISTLSVEGCACLCASSQRIARMRKRSIDRENVDGSVETWEPPSFKIVWGPVSEERAVRFGAISGCESILIRPTMTLELEGMSHSKVH